MISNGTQIRRHLVIAIGLSVLFAQGQTSAFAKPMKVCAAVHGAEGADKWQSNKKVFLNQQPPRDSRARASFRAIASWERIISRREPAYSNKWKDANNRLVTCGFRFAIPTPSPIIAMKPSLVICRVKAKPCRYEIPSIKNMPFPKVRKK